VKLFDVHGRLLRTLLDQPWAEAGYHDVTIDGLDSRGGRLASGVYYVMIRSEGTAAWKAITVLK